MRFLRDFFDSALNSRRGLCALMALSIGLRLFSLGTTQVISNDGPSYINQARLFSEGHFLQAISLDITFLYSLLIAGLNRFIFDPVLCGRVISLIATLGTLVFVYFLAERLWNSRIAFWVGIAFVLSPGLNEYSIRVMRDPLFLLVFSGTLYLSLKAFENFEIRWFLATSFGTLLLIFTRWEGGLFPLIFGFTCILWILRGSSKRKPIIYGFGAYFLPFILIMAFLLAFEDNSRVGRIDNLVGYVERIQEQGLFGYHPQIKTELKKMEQIIPGGGPNNDFAEISRENIRLIYFWGVFKLWAVTFFWSYATVVSAGFLFFRKSFGKMYFFTILLISFFLLAYFFNLHSGYLENRYLYVPILLSCLFFGPAATRLWDLHTGRWRKGWQFLLFVGLILLPFHGIVTKGLEPQPVSAKLAGEWLAQQKYRQGIDFLANDKIIPFYAGLGLNYIAGEFVDEDSFATMAAERGVEIITIKMEKDDFGNFKGYPGFMITQVFFDREYAGIVLSATDTSIIQTD